MRHRLGCLASENKAEEDRANPDVELMRFTFFFKTRILPRYRPRHPAAMIEDLERAGRGERPDSRRKRGKEIPTISEET